MTRFSEVQSHRLPTIVVSKIVTTIRRDDCGDSFGNSNATSAPIRNIRVTSFNLVIPIASVIGYTLGAGLLQITYGFFVEQRNKRHLSNIFGQYIPPKVVEEIDASGAEVSLEGMY